MLQAMLSLTAYRGNGGCPWKALPAKLVHITPVMLLDGLKERTLGLAQHQRARPVQAWLRQGTVVGGVR